MKKLLIGLFTIAICISGENTTSAMKMNPYRIKLCITTDNHHVYDIVLDQDRRGEYRVLTAINLHTRENVTTEEEMRIVRDGLIRLQAEDTNIGRIPLGYPLFTY